MWAARARPFLHARHGVQNRTSARENSRKLRLHARLFAAGQDGGRWKCGMERRFDPVAIANAVCVAGYAAIMLGYVAHYNFGYSRAEIRGGALTAALLLVALIVIDFLGNNGGRAG